MYLYGHYGAALLAFAPLGFALTAAGAPGAALVVGVVTVGLAPLPDWDHRVPLLDHRGVTHTVAFALLVGLVAGAVGLAVGGSGAGDTVLAGSGGGLAGGSGGEIGPAPALGAMGFVAGTLSMLTHLAADAVTPMGIAPLWPVSSRRYSLELVRSANPVANYLLLAVGVVVAGVTLYAGTVLAGI
ncbi:metal-dependent hydrolase [Halobacteriales archaeon QS_8_69_26]|nr:MAG: metal-dependent hydrolase [Halobacteriales archaeon QS_8_69_26]